MEHIFEPFYTTKETEKSTGLGLSSAMGIVFSHDGAISVTSTPGQGEIFDVFLPLSAEEPRRQSTRGG